MSLVVEDYIYYFQYLLCLIGRTINIEDQYGLRDGSSVNSLGVDKVTIYKVAGSSTVQECLNGVEFASVSCADFHQQDQECSMCIQDIGKELFGQLFLLFWSLGSCMDHQGRKREEYICQFIVICINFFYIEYSKPIYREKLGYIFCWLLYAKSSSERDSISSAITTFFKAIRSSISFSLCSTINYYTLSWCRKSFTK